MSLVSLVEQLMRRALGWKARTHSWMKLDLFRLGDQYRLALQYENQFVLLAVPVQQGRLAAGI